MQLNKRRSIAGATCLLLSMTLILAPSLASQAQDPGAATDSVVDPNSGLKPEIPGTAATPAAVPAAATDEPAAATPKPKKEKKSKKKEKAQAEAAQAENTHADKAADDAVKAEAADAAKSAAAAREAKIEAAKKEKAIELDINKTNGEEGELKLSKTKKPATPKEEKKEEKKDETAKAPADPGRAFAPEAIKNYNQGVELQQQGFLNQAIQKYKAALDVDDRIERAYCNLGLIYIAQHNFSRASDAFKKALNLKPNNPYSLNGMGSVYYSKGKLDEAMERWKKAVEFDPNFFSAYFNMGNAWKNQKDLEKALDNYVLTIKTSPNMADAYFEIGMILARQKHPAQAQTMLAKALLLAPEGEWVAEAKKQLSGIDGMMGKEEIDSEVKMNIVAPPSTPSTKEPSPDESSK